MEYNTFSRVKAGDQDDLSLVYKILRQTLPSKLILGWNIFVMNLNSIGLIGYSILNWHCKRNEPFS